MFDYKTIRSYRSNWLFGQAKLILPLSIDYKSYEILSTLFLPHERVCPWMRLNPHIVYSHFLVDTIPWNTPGWKLQRYSCACGFYSWRCKIPTSFLAPLPGNSSYIIYGLSRPRIFFFLFLDSTSTTATHGAAIPFTALFTQERVLGASTLCWPNSFY